MNNECREFLRKNGMLADEIDPDLYSDLFKREIELGINSRPSSLAMLSSHIKYSGQLPKSCEAVVIDAGGTNLRIGLIRFDSEGKETVSELQKYPMPGISEAVDIEDFFGFLADKLCAYEPEDVGFCFSYPAYITKDKDAKILAFKKEVRISNAGGRLVAEGINNVLERKGFKKKNFTLLNDTSAVLLGASERIQYPFGSAMALVLGTGINMCFVEDRYIVNTECGNFNRFPQGTLDKELDAASAEPGLQQAEKMIGGVYLPKIIQKAAEAAGGFEDEIRDEVYKRAAKLVVCEAAGILKYQMPDKEKTSYMAAEGSSFMKVPALQGYIYKYFDEYIVNTLGFNAKIIKAEDSTLKGAGIAALGSRRR